MMWFDVVDLINGDITCNLSSLSLYILYANHLSNLQCGELREVGELIRSNILYSVVT